MDIILTFPTLTNGNVINVIAKTKCMETSLYYIDTYNMWHSK